MAYSKFSKGEKSAFKKWENLENAADASLSSKVAASKYIEINNQNLPDDKRYRRAFVFDLPPHLHSEIELWKMAPMWHRKEKTWFQQAC